MSTTNNKNCFITGATNGIGKETAIAVARAGFSIYLMARNASKAETVKNEIIQLTGNPNINILIGDMASLADVRRVAAEFLAKKVPLHLLINNAGVVNTNREVTVDGYEGMFAVNHLAPFLLTQLLLDNIKASAPARIVNVASDAHRFVKGLDFDDLQTERAPFKAMKIYGASKLCNLYFTRELAGKLQGTRVTVNAVHPGWVGTGLGGNNGWLGKVITTLQKPFARSPAKGAETSIYVALSPELERVNGNYYYDCREHKPSRAGRDDEAARRLWMISDALVS